MKKGKGINFRTDVNRGVFFPPKRQDTTLFLTVDSDTSTSLELRQYNFYFKNYFFFSFIVKKYIIFHLFDKYNCLGLNIERM